MTSWNYHSVPGVWHWHSLWKDNIVLCFNYYYRLLIQATMNCSFLTDDRIIILSPGENEREGDKSPSFFIRFTNTANKTFFFFSTAKYNLHQFHSQAIPPNMYPFYFATNQYFSLNCCSFKYKMKFSYSSKLWKPLYCVMHYTESFCRDGFGFNIRFSLTKQKNLKK